MTNEPPLVAEILSMNNPMLSADGACEKQPRLGSLGLASGWALKRPALTIGVKPGVPPLYSLAGWHELDRYASRNQPLWCAVRRRCIESGVSEIDGLKLLCAALVDESEARKETIIKYVEHGGFLPPNIKVSNAVSDTQRQDRAT